MITLRKNTERRHLQRGKQDIWLTFYPHERPDPLTDSFGILIAFDELRLPLGAVSALLTLEGAEIVTYVYSGALAQGGSNGNSGLIHAGEFQRMSIGRAIRHKETNALRTDFTHIFRISLHHTEVGLDSAYEQKRFPVGQRRNSLCVIASPDGRKKSLRLLQDALIYSSILNPGYHIVHEILPGRRAWLHVITGGAAVQGIILSEGDGAGVAIEPSLSFTAQENTEILLVDLGPTPRSFV